MKILWKGKGLKEKCYCKNKIIIEIDRKYFRPTEVNSLKGNSKYARKKLQWKPKYNVTKLINQMVAHEMKDD